MLKNNTQSLSSTIPGNSVVDLGPNVKIFDPSMPNADIQSIVDSIFKTMESNEFSDQRYVFLFKPGTYNVNINVGFYTSVIGLGMTPDDVDITGSVGCNADWRQGIALCNFWRSIESVSLSPTRLTKSITSTGTEMWAVSQAAPMRRVHIKGSLHLWDSDYHNAWSSGGFIADSKIDVLINSGTQQQFLTRNSQMQSWEGINWNMVFVGNLGAPTDDLVFPTIPNTVIANTPVVREKPFLTIDKDGKYSVFVPDVRQNSKGVSWENGIGEGTLLPIYLFYIAHEDIDTAESINTALNEGKNILFTPGIYHLEESIKVDNPNTVILGLGLVTLIPENGTAAMNVADVDGVKIAGILFDAGEKISPVLLEVGTMESLVNHSDNPTSLSDLFFRIGGADVGKADVSLIINSNDVIGDHFWIWRADHGTGVGWTSNTTKNGIVVNGNDVIIYGLFVEHFHEYQTVWNGNGGKVYLYQSEIPYDVPDQSAWMSKNGAINGYTSYKVSDSVTTHQLIGAGVYSYFRDAVIKANSAIEVPNTPGVKVHHATSIFLNGNGEITHVINDKGDTAKLGYRKQTITTY